MVTPVSMKLVTKPTREPVTLEEAKAQLKVDFTDDDVEIDRLIIAARGQVENDTRQRIVRQKWRLYYSCFADIMEVAPAFVREVDAIQYIDTDGATQTAATSLYDVDVSGQRVIRAYAQVWPSVRYQENPVWIDVWVGMYDETASPVDIKADIEEPIKQAVLMIVQHMYDGTEEHGAEYLMAPYKMYRMGG